MSLRWHGSSSVTWRHCKRLQVRLTSLMTCQWQCHRGTILVRWRWLMAESSHITHWDNSILSVRHQWWQSVTLPRQYHWHNDESFFQYDVTSALKSSRFTEIFHICQISDDWSISYGVDVKLVLKVLQVYPSGVSILAKALLTINDHHHLVPSAFNEALSNLD